MTPSPRWLLCFVLCALFPTMAEQSSASQPSAQRDRTNVSVGQSFTGHYEGAATNKAQQVIPLAIDLTDAGGHLSGELVQLLEFSLSLAGTTKLMQLPSS